VSLTEKVMEKARGKAMATGMLWEKVWGERMDLALPRGNSSSQIQD
jgi:hypothetical protein